MLFNKRFGDKKWYDFTTKYARWFALAVFIVLLIVDAIYPNSSLTLSPMYKSLFWLMGPLLIGLVLISRIWENNALCALVLSLFALYFGSYFGIGPNSDRLLIFLKIALVPYFLMFFFKGRSHKTMKKTSTILFILTVSLMVLGWTLYIDEFSSNQMSFKRINRFLSVSNFINQHIEKEKVIAIDPEVHTKWSYGRCIPYLTKNRITNDAGYDWDYLKKRFGLAQGEYKSVEFFKKAVHDPNLSYILQTFIIEYPKLAKNLTKEMPIDYILIAKGNLNKFSGLFDIVYEDEWFGLVCLKSDS